jgi:hypothetical protein
VFLVVLVNNVSYIVSFHGLTYDLDTVLTLEGGTH